MRFCLFFFLFVLFCGQIKADDSAAEKKILFWNDGLKYVHMAVVRFEKGTSENEAARHFMAVGVVTRMREPSLNSWRVAFGEALTGFGETPEIGVDIKQKLLQIAGHNKVKYVLPVFRADAIPMLNQNRVEIPGSVIVCFLNLEPGRDLGRIEEVLPPGVVVEELLFGNTLLVRFEPVLMANSTVIAYLISLTGRDKVEFAESSHVLRLERWNPNGEERF